MIFLGHLFLKRFDGRPGRAGIAGVGLLLVARIAAERGEQAVEAIESALGDAFDVLRREADFFQQPRHGAAAEETMVAAIT